jgi:hypothetical protein
MNKQRTFCGEFQAGLFVNNAVRSRWKARQPSDSVGPSGEFTTYSPSTLTYNLLPKAGAPIIGAGTTGSPLPTVDILGAARSQPYEVGAYTTLQ